MPFPGAALEGFLGGELGVVVVHLATEQVFHGVDHPVAARRQAVDALARMIPGDHARGFAARVIAVVEVAANRRVLLDGGAHQADFLGVEQPAHEHEAVAVESRPLLGRENGFGWRGWRHADNLRMCGFGEPLG